MHPDIRVNPYYVPGDRSAKPHPAKKIVIESNKGGAAPTGFEPVGLQGTVASYINLIGEFFWHFRYAIFEKKTCRREKVITGSPTLRKCLALAGFGGYCMAVPDPKQTLKTKKRRALTSQSMVSFKAKSRKSLTDEEDRIRSVKLLTCSAELLEVPSSRSPSAGYAPKYSTLITSIFNNG
jgi:hypothetical protein